MWKRLGYAVTDSCGIFLVSCVLILFLFFYFFNGAGANLVCFGERDYCRYYLTHPPTPHEGGLPVHADGAGRPLKLSLFEGASLQRAARCALVRGQSEARLHSRWGKRDRCKKDVGPSFIAAISFVGVVSATVFGLACVDDL